MKSPSTHTRQTAYSTFSRKPVDRTIYDRGCLYQFRVSLKQQVFNRTIRGHEAEMTERQTHSVSYFKKRPPASFGRTRPCLITKAKSDARGGLGQHSVNMARTFAMLTTLDDYHLTFLGVPTLFFLVPVNGTADWAPTYSVHGATTRRLHIDPADQWKHIPQYAVAMECPHDEEQGEKMTYAVSEGTQGSFSVSEEELEQFLLLCDDLYDEYTGFSDETRVAWNLSSDSSSVLYERLSTVESNGQFLDEVQAKALEAIYNRHIKTAAWAEFLALRDKGVNTGPYAEPVWECIPIARLPEKVSRYIPPFTRQLPPFSHPGPHFSAGFDRTAHQQLEDAYVRLEQRKDPAEANKLVSLLDEVINVLVDANNPPVNANKPPVDANKTPDAGKKGPPVHPAFRIASEYELACYISHDAELFSSLRRILTAAPSAFTDFVVVRNNVLSPDV